MTGNPKNWPMSSKQAGEAAMCLSFSYVNALQNAIEQFNPKAGYTKMPGTPLNVSAAIKLDSNSLQITNQ